MALLGARDDDVVLDVVAGGREGLDVAHGFDIEAYHGRRRILREMGHAVGQSHVERVADVAERGHRQAIVGGVHGRRHTEAAALGRDPETASASGRHERDDRRVQPGRCIENPDTVGADHMHAGGAGGCGQPALQPGPLLADFAKPGRYGEEEGRLAAWTGFDRLDEARIRSTPALEVDGVIYAGSELTPDKVRALVGV